MYSGQVATYSGEGTLKYMPRNPHMIASVTDTIADQQPAQAPAMAAKELRPTHQPDPNHEVKVASITATVSCQSSPTRAPKFSSTMCPIIITPPTRPKAVGSRKSPRNNFDEPAQITKAAAAAKLSASQPRLINMPGIVKIVVNVSRRPMTI